MKDSLIQKLIINALGVKPMIDVAEEVVTRVNFLDNYMRKAGAEALVLGISGGIDSTVAGRLCQMAVEQARRRHPVKADFYAVRLPYGVQSDESDAQKALQFINPDYIKTVNIARASDAMLFEINCGEQLFRDDEHEDFVMGNIKARQRMIAQYAIAGAVNGLVVGTDHASEAVMGFFTKGGDGFADIMPLAGLTKDQIRGIALYLNVPDELINKTPQAGLEVINPRSDEEAFGFPYEHVNMYLKGQDIPEASEDKLVATYIKTQHKRALPVVPDPADSYFD